MNKFAPFQKATKSIHFQKKGTSDIFLRMYLIPLVCIFIVLIFMVRLFHLTIVKGTYYRYIAENNRIRELLIDGKRGEIYDRKGFVLARSEPVKSKKENERETYAREYVYGDILAQVIGYRSIASKKNIQEDACSEALVLNDKVGVKGIEKLYECHLRPVKGKKLIEVDAKGQFVKTLSKMLPKDGKPIWLSIDKELQEKTARVISSNDIKTSVEIDLREKKVSVVGMDPRTGEVLVLYSYPSFNPQAFEDGDQEMISHYFKDKEKPLFNRALLGTYPPGSVFKTVIASGALEEKAVTPEDTVEDTGSIKAGPIEFRNWFYVQYGRTDGSVDMIKGLQRSNDIYFYRTGEKLTAPKIKKWAEIFGYGRKTNIGLEEEMGLIPSDFWKRETIGERWFLGDTYNISIGQGYLLATPIQVAQATMPFANGGKICTPQLLKLGAEENKGLVDSEPHCRSLGLSKETIETVREGMKRACQSGGTGWPFFNFEVEESVLSKEDIGAGNIVGIVGEGGSQVESDKDGEGGKNEGGSQVESDDAEGGEDGDGERKVTSSAKSMRRIEVGCKTGTAESHKESGMPHAWFTIFAPYENPEIVLTVMVEEAGEGSYIAAPIAKEILKMYFERSE